MPVDIFDLNLFSIISTRVVGSTPGNSTSTNPAIVDALALQSRNSGRGGLYIPRALSSVILAGPCSPCFVSSANSLSSAAILLCVELGCLGLGALGWYSELLGMLVGGTLGIPVI